MSEGAALAFAFALGWIPLFLYRAEAMQDALPYYSDVERRWVRLTPAVLGVHTTLASLVLSLSDPSGLSTALAVAVYVVGMVFWFWARSQIGPLRITRLPDELPGRLRRDGPFGVVRNPLYLGYLIVAAAPVIAAEQPILLISWGLCFAALAVRADQEERRLHRQLGAEYAAYCREVKRLIPFVW
jgi:protein-S-isoprenylcysteine O-methyltransferase Ste14